MRVTTGQRRLPYLLFFISGAAALIYQVLWVRELSLLFGGTTQAAALAIAVFFGGIAGGSWYWGRRAAARGGLRLFGLLELGVAVTALGHFAVLPLYHLAYPSLYAATGGGVIPETALIMLIAATLLLPPAFLMGGTLPAMGQHMVRLRKQLGTTGSGLYAVNTAGSATGALAAGFVLPTLLGFRDAYLLAVAMDTVVGLGALLLAHRHGAPATARGRREVERRRRRKTAGGSAPDLPLPERTIWLLAFGSGFATLAVEIVWTRLFSQILQNSVYTYSLVLVIFLLALSLGAGLARVLAGSRLPALPCLTALLLASALATISSPWVFQLGTSGLDYVGAGLGWWPYLATVAGTALLVMLLPATAFGVILPFLLRVLQARQAETGDTVGRLILFNTTGAIAGTLITGFLLLAVLGTGATLLWLGALYLVMAAWILRRQHATPRLQGAAPAAAAVATVLLYPLLPHPVPLSAERGETLIDHEEGIHATVAVIERDGHRLIRVNNHYVLGGTGALEAERNQTVIPLLIHAEPRSVFYLGLGTGITAGAVTDFPVERVVACEILPEVIRAARAHFAPWTGGLFSDPRVTVRAADGRNCLARSEERFDVIISDLFTPWKAGTGNLYTLEHYRTARERLADNGIFVQWIPLYQVSERELASIARTMDAVFPQVVAWRGDLLPDKPILALVGQRNAAPLDPATVIRQARTFAGENAPDDATLAASVLRFYAGNVSASGLFDDAPLNTDNRPFVEYQAPRTQRAVQVGEAEWMHYHLAATLYEELLQNPGPARDPYLRRLTAVQRGYVVAGRSFYHHAVLGALGRAEMSEHFLEDFLRRTPFEAAPVMRGSSDTLSGWEAE